MKTLFVTLVFLASLPTFAAPKGEKATTEKSAEEKPPLVEVPQKESVVTCDSFKVFRDTVDYLKSQADLPFTEPQILKAALEINKGCDGADRRFRKIFELLSKSGVSIKKCYELAVNFSHMSNEKADNFAVLFRGLFLENKFDMDFMTAYKVSLELSADLPKDWDKVRRDFNRFLNFCSSAKSEELPIRLCAEWTLSLLKNEDLFINGIYYSFSQLNDYLVKRAGPQLPINDRLNLITEIISHGPKAPGNFQKALEWLNSSKGAGMPTTKAHRLALEIAKNSLKQPEPTVESEKTDTP